MEKQRRMKTGSLFSSMVVAVFIICLLMPQTAIGKSNEQAIIGPSSEDPGGDAKHPADDSRGSLVVCVASKFNQDTDEYNIRFGYSANSGVSWQGWDWVSSSTNEQDYPDVRIYQENGDRIKFVVVWQERIDDNSLWRIKASTKYYSPPTNWITAIDISDTQSQYDQIYPKIDTMVLGTGYGSGYYHYWNIVWQEEDSSNNWDIKLYTRYYTTGNPTENINNIISDSGSYRHPAVACNYISGTTCEVHIVYDAHISTNHYVQVQSGWVDPTCVYTQYNGCLYNVDIDNQDSDIGYPDIVSAGPGGGPGHPNGQGGQANVWIAWHHITNNNKVKKAYSSDSLNTMPTLSTIISNNGPSTSAVLRCVAIGMNEPSTSPVAIVWTDDSDIYFVSSSDWTDIQQWTSTEDADIHVDVSLSTPTNPPTTYSHVVWQRNDQNIYYARDP